MNSDWIHLFATILWGVFGIAIGSIGIVYDYSSYWLWLAIITAIVGNSAHLVAFAWSKGKAQISSSTTTTAPKT